MPALAELVGEGVEVDMMSRALGDCICRCYGTIACLGFPVQSMYSLEKRSINVKIGRVEDPRCAWPRTSRVDSVGAR